MLILFLMCLVATYRIAVPFSLYNRYQFVTVPFRPHRSRPTFKEVCPSWRVSSKLWHSLGEAPILPIKKLLCDTLPNNTKNPAKAKRIIIGITLTHPKANLLVTAGRPNTNAIPRIHILLPNNNNNNMTKQHQRCHHNFTTLSHVPRPCCVTVPPRPNHWPHRDHNLVLYPSLLLIWPNSP